MDDYPRSRKITLLDGATGTNLYAMGMPQGVCVEKWILENPDAIISLQRGFADAGSDIVYAPTFSANRAKLGQYGLADKVREYNLRLVELTKTAVDGRAEIGADLSPTGLFVEPFGEASFDELVDIYRQQASALAEAGVDVFALETMMTLSDMRAAVLACREFGKAVYVSMTINQKGKSLSGCTPLSALISLQELGIDGFGINCSDGIEAVIESIKEMAPFAKIPLIAKPNAGKPNPLIPNLYDISPTKMRELMRELLDSGASIIGGCCGTTVEHIAEMRRLIDEYQPTALPSPPENLILLSNETESFLLDNSRIEFSEPISCESDMSDELLDVEDDSTDIITISIDTPDEAEQFAENAHFAKLPVCFVSSSAEALEIALYHYNGRAMIDLNSDIDQTLLKSLAKKYGAAAY